jgi:predicted MFS family arabinose efflux permease
MPAISQWLDRAFGTRHQRAESATAGVANNMSHNDQSHSTGQAFGTSSYRNYVLIALTLVYTLNFIDRILIGVVAQPIIDEFKLQDWQFGLLSGFAFALMYSVVGIPIARLAEHANRVKIIAASIILWSAMTALCGVAGSFAALLIFRIGVGIGEAGLTPPANSILADYFPPRSRARALATYAMGVTFGGVLANLFGGPIAQAFSWREAFLLLGIPGVIIGFIVLFTIKEPPRGYSDPVGTPALEKRGIKETLSLLAGKKTFWLNVIGATLTAFVGYAVSNFLAPFFGRVHGMSVADIAITVSVPIGLAATAGTFLAGFLTERISRKYPTSVAWIPAAMLIGSVPFYWIGFSSDSIGMATAFILIGSFLHYGYLGAQYTICQSVVDARSRATAIAIMLFIVNFIGYGLGPLVVGYMSDVFASGNLSDANLTLAMCKGTDAELLKTIGAAQLETCRVAGAEGLRQSLRLATTIYGLAGAFYWWTSRTLDKDIIARMD